jgi:hypothetical protein
MLHLRSQSVSLSETEIVSCMRDHNRPLKTKCRRITFESESVIQMYFHKLTTTIVGPIDRRSKTPTGTGELPPSSGQHQSRINGHMNGQQSQPVYASAQQAPGFKPRSKTPASGALPPRPQRPNGFTPQNGGYQRPQANLQQQIDPSTGLPIYENLSRRAGGGETMTPNYVPASVYTRGTTPTPLEQGYGAPMGYETVTVNLIKQPAGFGFRVVGGTEVWPVFAPKYIFITQAGTIIHIGNISPGGAAALDNRLCVKDEIVEIDGHSVLNGKHETAIKLMEKAKHNGHVKLVVRRPLRGIMLKDIIISQLKLGVQAPMQAEPYINSHMSRSASMPPTQQQQAQQQRQQHYGEYSHSTLPGTSGYNDASKHAYDVHVRRGVDEGFGFVIISNVLKNGSTIGMCK